MATSKVIKTKILLRTDTWENWSNVSTTDFGGNLVLLKGEIGIVQKTTTSQASNYENQFKIGNGTTPFKDLPWANVTDLNNYYNKTEINNLLKTINLTYAGGADGGVLTLTAFGDDGKTKDITATIPLADNSTPGLMSPTQSTKLSGIATGATKVEKSNTNGNIKINGTETKVYDDTAIKTDIAGVQEGLNNKIDKNQIGAANGVAGLDANKKIQAANLPDFILGQLLFGGTFTNQSDGSFKASLSTNGKTKLGTTESSITLVNSADGSSTSTTTYGYTRTEGMYFIASSMVNQTFAGEVFNTGDWLVSIGTGWRKIDNTDAVKSVNGQTGDVEVTGFAGNKAVGNSNTPVYFKPTTEGGELIVPEACDGKVVPQPTAAEMGDSVFGVLTGDPTTYPKWKKSDDFILNQDDKVVILYGGNASGYDDNWKDLAN